jgi:hypothetical protein
LDINYTWVWSVRAGSGLVQWLRSLVAQLHWNATMRQPFAGLCLSCRHSQVIRNERGSVFRLCELAASDRSLQKYPQLPVLDCHGYDPVVASPSTSDDPPPATDETSS